MMDLAAAQDLFNRQGNVSAVILTAASVEGVAAIQDTVEELHPEFAERFFFIDEMLTLVISKPLATTGPGEELYRYAGQVLFRGFEVTRPTRVYEILRADNPFTQLLAEHHLQDWLIEAEQNPACRLDSL